MSSNDASRSVHVLAVTADADYGREITTRLEDKPGVRVSVVETANDAMATMAAADDVECVVSDHDTPDVDAVAFLETVRSEYPDLPFILFTSEGSEEVASRAIHARVTDYLIKERYRDEWDRLVTLLDRAIEYYWTHTSERHSPERSRPILEAMPDMIGVLRDGEFAYVNARGVELLGADGPGELVGTPLFDVIEETELTTRTLRGVQTGERHIDAVETRLVDATEAAVPVELTASRIRWEGSAATLVVVSVRAEVESLERRLRAALRINAVVRDVNHLVINAHSRAELERQVCERFAESGSYRFAWIGEADSETGVVEPRASAGIEAGYLDDVLITSGSGPTGRGPTGRAIRTREIQVAPRIDEDPSFTPWKVEALERGFLSSVAIPLLSNSTLYGVLNLYADRPNAFDERELEMLRTLAGDIAFALHALADRAELERNEERLSLALEAADAGVWDWLVAEDEVVWDEHVERLFGLGPGAFEGTYEGFIDRVHPDDRSDLESAIERALSEPGHFESEFRIRRDDGGERWVRSEGTVVTDESGDPIRLLGVDVDITDRKEREQHLRVIDRVLRHNLTNDLNVVEGSAETIRERASGEIATLAERIVDHSERLLRTADKEREIVAILTEPPSMETLDVVEAVRTVVDRVRERYPDAVVDVESPATAAATVTDRFPLALEELLENAIVHNDRARPSVTVAVERADDAVRIRLADDAPHIPEMNVGVLTGEGDIEPLYHGSGLGLWLVHWVVQRSEGTLDFEARDERGNVVTLRLPPARGDERP